MLAGGGSPESSSSSSHSHNSPFYRSGLFCTHSGCNGLWGSREAGGGGGGGAAGRTPSTPPPAPASGQQALAQCYTQLSNLLTIMLRRHTGGFNVGSLVCEDALCGMRTRAIGAAKGGRACPRPGCTSLLWPEREPSVLHNQLEYLHCLLDVEGAWVKRERAIKAAEAEGAPDALLTPPTRLPPLPREVGGGKNPLGGGGGGGGQRCGKIPFSLSTM